MSIKLKNDEDMKVCSFPRGNGEEVRITLRPYRTQVYVDIRQWYKPMDDKRWLPTKRGVYFPVDSLDQFKSGFDKLVEMVERLKEID